MWFVVALQQRKVRCLFICISLRASVLEFDAPPPATALVADVGDIEGFLKLGLERLDRERFLAMPEHHFWYRSNSWDEGIL